MTRSDRERIADILAAIAAGQRYRRYLADPNTDVAKMAIDAVLRNVADLPQGRDRPGLLE